MGGVLGVLGDLLIVPVLLGRDGLVADAAGAGVGACGGGVSVV